MANKRPFIVDPALTAISIGYRNTANMLIADKVLPRMPVGGEKFKYAEYPLGEAFSIPDNEVGRRGRVPQIEFSANEKTDSVNDYGYETPIPYSDIEEAKRMRDANLGTYDPEAHTTMMLTNLNMLRREKRVADLVQASGNYDASRKVALTGTDKFSDYANSDPIDVLKAAINGTLIFRANILTMGQAVWQVMSSHPDIVNAIRGSFTNKGIVRREELAALLEIREILVGEAYLNTAAKGQAPTLARVWGNSIQALYIDASARPEDGMTFGFTAEYGSRIAGRIEDENVGLQGGTIVRQGERVKELICAPSVGYQISGVI